MTMRRYIIRGGIIIAAIFFFCNKSNAQVIELSCPAGTTSVQSLQSTNQGTSKLRQNYCVDSSGNIFENISGTLSVTGPIKCKNINNINCVDSLNSAGRPGNDVGAWLNSAFAGVANVVQLAPGSYSSSTPIILPAGAQLELHAGTTFVSSGSITLNQGSVISAPLVGFGTGSVNSSIILQQAANANLSPFILSQGSQASIIGGLTIDCNKANNPTSGRCILSTFATPGTFAGRQKFVGLTVQNSKSDGIAIISSSVANNEMGGTQVNDAFTINNDGDGLYVINTGDVASLSTSYENSGLTTSGGAFGTFTTVNVAAGATNAVVTWVSGEKWTTDASLVGRDITVNNINWRDGISGTIPVHMTIGSISSTTSLTLACGNANQAACPGALNGVTFRMGYGVEAINSSGIRFSGAQCDFGGSVLSGFRLAGTTGGGSTPNFQNMIGDGCQFGNNVENDIQIDGWDVIGNGRVNFQHRIANGYFIDGTTRLTGLYDAIYIQDSGGNYITGNYFLNNAPNYRSAVRVHETTLNRENQDHITGNMTEGQSWTSTAFFTDTGILTIFDGNRDRSLADPTGGGRFMVRRTSNYIANLNSFFGQLANASLVNILKEDASNNLLIGDANNNSVTIQQNTVVPKLFTSSNCSSSASPAVCGSASSGSFNLPTGSTTVTVNTTAVSAASIILIQNDDSLGTRLGVTCNTTLDQVFVSARVAGTSFTITGTAPVTNPNCYSYLIIN